MDPMMVEEDRDAVTAFFRAQPLYFDGTRRTVFIDAWLHDMEPVFQLVHIEDHLQVTLASRCFYGDARLWWVDLGECQLPSRTWDEFRIIVRGRYGPLPPRWIGTPIRDPEIY